MPNKETADSRNAYRCPKCKTFTMVLEIHNYSSAPHPDYGTVYQWDGEAKCIKCGHEEYIADSSI